jgi:Carboxysome Shell Carbonic Anhydrase
MQVLMKELIEMADANSRIFCDPGVRARLARLMRKFAVLITCLKCGDGRVHLPLVTGMPIGFIQPIRSLGGIFSTGWFALSERLCQIVEEAIDQALRNLFLVVYHYSESDDKTLGCRGAGYSKDTAMEHTMRFVHEAELLFGIGHDQVEIMPLGLETDMDALVFHDRKGDKKLEILRFVNEDETTVREEIRALCPERPKKIVNCLTELAMGNIAHIRDLQMRPRVNERNDHHEQVVGIGTGFQGIHVINRMVIVSPLVPDLPNSIGMAADILRENFETGRITKPEGVLFSNIGYSKPGLRREAAVAQSLYLAREAREVSNQRLPQFEGGMQELTCVTNLETLKLEILQINGKAA